MTERVRYVGFEAIGGRLPVIEQYQPERICSGRPAALYICALGFEQRCVSFPERLARDGFKALKSICFVYPTSQAENEANRPELSRHLEKISPGEVHFRPLDYSKIRDALAEVNPLNSMSSPGNPGSIPRVILDISVASTQLILGLMSALFDQNVSVTVLYSEANVYFPTSEEYAQKEGRETSREPAVLEEGVSDVSISPDYPGETAEQVPDCVVVFPNFSPQRALAALAKVDPALVTSLPEVPPDSLIWILGQPHAPEDGWRLDAVKELNRISARPGGQSPTVHVASTFDYRQTLRVLEEVYLAYGTSRRLTIVPLGSKLQSLGISLFCRIHGDVRVVTSAPRSYRAKHYTEGCKGLWMIESGPLQELDERLASIEKLEIYPVGGSVQ